jgi:hypothetical protein
LVASAVSLSLGRPGRRTDAAVLPYTPLRSLLRFVPPPVTLLATIAGLALTYLLLVQAVKTWFYRRHALL